MYRCPKCNHELIKGARFCNICRTLIPATPLSPPAAPAAPGGLKRTINPEVRRVPASRRGQVATNSPAPGPALIASGTPGKPAPDMASGAAETTTEPLPLTNAGASRTPGIIRPILSLTPLRQSTPPPPAYTPPDPQPPLQQTPVSYPTAQNGNGAQSALARAELPFFSPESFAHTSKAAQHWRNSWRDRQNAEDGPAEDVSKGQAAVPAPLASRQDSFLRMRATGLRQNQDGSDRSFGFWVTLFLMVCLIAGLGAYIVYSFLPNTSLADRNSQPGGVLQPAFTVVGAPSQTFSRGQSLRAHGEHFGANDAIKFLLDSTTPVLASTGSPLSIQSDGQGSFDATILVGQDWTTGSHVISATDARANLSAFLDMQVNPASTPVSGTNNTELAFSLDGQPIDHLSFTAQAGQSPPAQRFTFTNISGSPLQWSAAASTPHNLNWLGIVDGDYAGQLDISEPHTMGIIINTAGLAATPAGKAPYTGQIVFTINGNTQLTLPVQLTIIDATPEMVFSPNPLVAAANANGTCQSGITLTFINLGTTVVSWSAHPDLQNNIQFVSDQGAVTENGLLQPSGMNGDTTVVTLRCNGVRDGDKYLVRVFANSMQFTEIVQIG